MRIEWQSVRQLTLSAIMTTLVFGAVSLPPAANAATYYVATTGNDANSGTAEQPFGTVGAGVSALYPGDTLYIRQGTYGEHINLGTMIVRSGTASAPITISGYPGETVILQGAALNSGVAYMIFDNLVFNGWSLYRV